MQIPFLTFLALFAFTSIGQAMPKKIILVRHCEEPNGEEGRELSHVGWRRATGLPKLLVTENITELIALYPHKKGGSIRSIQTLQPIAEALGLEIQSPFKRDEVTDLIKALSTPKYDDDVVLIAWQHDTLADIAHGLGANMAPKKWGNTFDRYWVLEFKKDGSLESFKNLPQRLLPNDSRD